MPRQKFAQIFGDDLTFDLRGLLVERASSDPRHGTSQGLFDYEVFTSSDALSVVGGTALVLHESSLCGKLSGPIGVKCQPPVDRVNLCRVACIRGPYCPDRGHPAPGEW